MNRNIVNLVVDCASLVALSGLIATGLIMESVLPPGTGGLGRGKGSRLWGWGRHDWGELHFYLAISFIALLAGHLALHWRWVWATGSRALRRRSETPGHARAWPPPPTGTAAGCAAIALMVGLVYAAFLRVDSPGGSRDGQREARQDMVAHGTHAPRWFYSQPRCGDRRAERRRYGQRWANAHGDSAVSLNQQTRRNQTSSGG